VIYLIIIFILIFFLLIVRLDFFDCAFQLVLLLNWWFRICLPFLPDLNCVLFAFNFFIQILDFVICAFFYVLCAFPYSLESLLWQIWFNYTLSHLGLHWYWQIILNLYFFNYPKLSYGKLIYLNLFYGKSLDINLD